MISLSEKNMKLVQPLEQNGYRIEVVLSPVELDTYSAIHNLSQKQKDAIKHQLLIAASYCINELMKAKNDEKNRSI